MPRQLLSHSLVRVAAAVTSDLVVPVKLGVHLRSQYHHPVLVRVRHPHILRPELPFVLELLSEDADPMDASEPMLIIAFELALHQLDQCLHRGLVLLFIH